MRNKNSKRIVKKSKFSLKMIFTKRNPKQQRMNHNKRQKPNQKQSKTKEKATRSQTGSKNKVKQSNSTVNRSSKKE